MSYFCAAYGGGLPGVAHCIREIVSEEVMLVTITAIWVTVKNTIIQDVQYQADILIFSDRICRHFTDKKLVVEELCIADQLVYNSMGSDM